MFAQPRQKKSLLPPPTKKRKTAHAIEEIPFDNSARADYLTGFHKRKQARIKHAQTIAAEKARQERIVMRKQLRDERKQELEEHVQTVDKMLKEAREAATGDVEREGDAEEDEWDGFRDEVQLQPVNVEDEYIDEDRYTTVTVESVTVDWDGLHKPEAEAEAETVEAEPRPSQPQRERPKKKKKKFRYETKFERRLGERKQRAKSKR